jgi:hypothetical protein
MARIEAEVPTDLLADLLIEQASAPVPRPRQPESFPAKVYAVIALTTVSTFGTLVTGYQLLFAHQLFA